MTTINPPRRVRAVLYLIGTLGIIGVQWANDKHWLDSADRTALAGVLALIMALATANTFTPDNTGRRNEAGRARPLLLVGLALVMAIAAALLTVASPAQATGWSGQRCQQSTVTVQVCINVHTIPSGNGVRIDQVQQCVTKHPSWPYPSARGTFGNAMAYYGSAGNFISAHNLADTGAEADVAVCVYSNPFAANQVGNGACYKASGTIDFPQGPDSPWNVNGKVLGGAYNC